MAAVLTELIEGIKRVGGTHIKSIVLFGSRATGETQDSDSDYNVLIVLDTVTITILDALSVLVYKWVKNGNHAPLIFSENEFIRSSDVFPIEFLDMRANHKILFGSDPFANITIDDRHLRHECEYELRSKLQKLRRSYAVAEGKKLALRALLGSSVSSLIVLFRYALKLSGVQTSMDKREILNQSAIHFGINCVPFEIALKVRADQLDLSSVELSEHIANYMTDIEKVITVVDEIK